MSGEVIVPDQPPPPTETRLAEKTASTRQLFSAVAEHSSILAALSVAGVWSHGTESPTSDWLTASLASVALFHVGWLLVARRLGAHAVSPSRDLAYSVARTMESWATTWGLAGLLAVTTIAPDGFQVWLALLAGAAMLCALRFATSFSQVGRLAGRARAIVIGSCPSARALTSTSDAEGAFHLCGFVPFASEDPKQMPHLKQLGALQDLSSLIRAHKVDVALVSPSDDAVTREVHQVMDTCEALGIQTQYFPSFLDVADMRVGITWSASRPGLNVQKVGKTSFEAACKRFIDVVGAAAGIVVLTPVLLACALIVKLNSRGPILYSQTRVGRLGRTFRCLKFRTMHVGAQEMQELLRSESIQDGPAFKLDSDPRVTRVGKVLRKFSLDELPQLFNVLKGDMSLVGPRPPMPSEVEKYAWWQRRRISIKPGLTCIWQVYGRNRVSFKRWVEMDLFYIDNWSLWLDIKLILKTVRVVFSGTGM